MEAHLEGALRLLEAAAETVHHAAPGGMVQLAQQGEDLVVGLADMQADREVEVDGPEELGFQDFALLGLEGAVPVEVHAYLAYCDIFCRRIGRMV